jgi:hypothetical protein
MTNTDIMAQSALVLPRRRSFGNLTANDLQVRTRRQSHNTQSCRPSVGRVDCSTNNFLSAYCCYRTP